MKHEHNEFPSDMYLMLETVGATLNIGEYNYERSGSEIKLIPCI
jgi:hypothetical protein